MGRDTQVACIFRWRRAPHPFLFKKLPESQKQADLGGNGEDMADFEGLHSHASKGLSPYFLQGRDAQSNICPAMPESAVASHPPSPSTLPSVVVGLAGDRRQTVEMLKSMRSAWVGFPV